MSKFDKRIAGMLGAAVAFALPAVSFATTPYSAGLDSSETMEADTDTYLPEDTQPIDDASLDGAGPGVLGADPGTPYGSPGEDAEDIRNGGGSGVYEEVPNGFLNQLGNPVVSPDGSAHFAIVDQTSGGLDAYTRTNRDRFNTIVSGYYGDNGYQATQDLYIDPAFQGNGYTNGLPDFWTTYSINSATSNSYATEAGTQIYQNGAFWDITFGGHPGVVYSAPVGTWVGIEMQPIPGVDAFNVPDGTVDMVVRVTNADHSVVLGSATYQEYTAAQVWSDMAGPRNNILMIFADGEIPYTFVDNVGWVSGRQQVVPEPTSLALLGLGAVGMLARRRRA